MGAQTELKTAEAASDADLDPKKKAAPVALPEEIESMLSVMRPGDSEPLARLLATFPAYRDAILKKAAAALGNETVAAALGTKAKAMGVSTSDAMGEYRGKPINDPALLASIEDGPAAGGGAGAGAEMKQFIQSNPGLADGGGAAPAAPAPAPSQQRADNAAAMKTFFEQDMSRADADAKAPAKPAPAPEEAKNKVPDPGDPLFLIWSLTDGTAQDVELAAKFIHNHPDRSDAAIAMLRKNLGDGFVEKVLAQAAEKQKPKQVEEKEATPPAAVTDDAKKAAEKKEEPEAKAESPWVIRARAFNESHFTEVEEFNALTNLCCMASAPIGGGVEIDPNRIATWQQAHGLHPDGRVGDATLAKARDVARAEGRTPAPDAAQDLRYTVE
jgi:hypothetical protein